MSPKLNLTIIELQFLVAMARSQDIFTLVGIAKGSLCSRWLILD